MSTVSEEGHFRPVLFCGQGKVVDNEWRAAMAMALSRRFGLAVCLAVREPSG